MLRKLGVLGKLGTLGRFGESAAVTPYDLFRASEQGVWLDPSDMSSMYQDSAGTTPVTAYEQPVGLILDKSKGLSLGSELVTNGDFSNETTGWTAGDSNSTISVVNGQLVCNCGPTTNVFVKQTINTVAGRAYFISANMVAISHQAAIRFNVGTLGIGETFSNTLGTRKTWFVATGATTSIQIAAASANRTGTFDSISVRELPGNHAYQSTSNKRPILSAIYNQLVSTENFSTSSWSKSGSCSVTGMHTINFPAEGDFISGTATIGIPAGTKFNGSIILSGSGTITLRIDRSGVGTYENTDVTITLTSTPTKYDISHTFLYAQTGVKLVIVRKTGNTATQVIATQADLRPSNDGVNLPAYQRVTSSTDYDTAGFPARLKFDGVDDSLVTNAIDFTATDKVTVWAGVRKLSESAFGIVYELSNTIINNNGVFALVLPTSSASNSFNFISKGTTVQNNSLTNSLIAPASGVITCQSSISTDVSVIRKNGNLVQSINDDQGTGNYGSYPLNIGARAGTSLFFSGYINGLIIRGAASSDKQISDIERYMNTKTRAY